MNVDSLGLPVTINHDGVRDANDQLQRVAALALASKVNEDLRLDVPDPIAPVILKGALDIVLQPEPGIYRRHAKADPDNCSGDQLVSAFAAQVVLRDPKACFSLTWKILRRGGFAQNRLDGLDGGANTKPKTPDFILARTLPLMWRCDFRLEVLRSCIFWLSFLFAGQLSAWLYVVSFLVSDVWLIIGALTAAAPIWEDGKGFAKRTPDDVDGHPGIMSLIACAHVCPTVMSRLACFLYAKLRPWNYGVCPSAPADPCESEETCVKRFGPVFGELRWYHRAESGGNPEVAEVNRQIINKYFWEKNP